MMKRAWQPTIQELRQAVLDRWMRLAISTFPDILNASGPAGQTLSEAMGMVLDGFERDASDAIEGIDGLARMFAVIPAPPSQSMAVIAGLLDILDELAPKELDRAACRARVEQLTFAAFDRFMAHRETLYRLKVDETRRSMHMLLRRVG